MEKFILLLVFILASCSGDLNDDKYGHIGDLKARAIIKKSIKDAGGLNKWNAIKSMQYKKNFALLDSTGKTEKTFVQDHTYSNSNKTIIIRSEENKDVLFTTLENGAYARSKNGQDLKLSQEALRKSVNSSLYVIGIPFKLIDPGAEIEYLGEESLNGKLLDVIKVSYDPKRHNNHSSRNIWKFYFDKSTARVVANWIESADHYNIVENLDFTRVDGLLFHKHRKSYRVDETGEKLYLRAEYQYFDYTVNK